MTYVAITQKLCSRFRLKLGPTSIARASFMYSKSEEDPFSSKSCLDYGRLKYFCPSRDIILNQNVVVATKAEKVGKHLLER